MKKAKIILTLITVFAVAGGALAFKAYKEYNGQYFCQETEGVCSNTLTKYKVVTTGNSDFLECNNGSGSTICNNELRVTTDAY